MKTYACVYFGSAVLVMFLVPIVTRIARALRIVDDPGVRKVHESAVPRIGGVPIAAATLTLLIAVLALDNVIGQAFREIQAKLTVVLAASLLMLLVGFIDDIRGLRARTKLVWQLLAAAAVCAAGIRIDSIGIADRFVWNFGWLAWPITIFWIVGITNAVNFIDGLDGLATGISAVACGVIAVFAFYAGEPVMGVLMLALLGSLTGFLFFNFNPAKVFLGDSGTLFVGFLLASSSVLCTAKSAALVGLALPALALGLPIFDTFFSIVRRILERRSIFAPDRNHIHHRLLQMGLKQRHAVIVMYGITLMAAAFGVFMMGSRGAGAVIIFICVLFALLAVFRVVGAVRLRESFATLKHNLAVARQAKEERRYLEDAELRVRESTSFNEWWRAVCTMAEEMEFEWLALTHRNGDGTTETSVWRRAVQQPPPDGLVTMTIPCDQDGPERPFRVDVAVRANGSLESAGRRVALLGRLIDGSGLDAAPNSPPPASAALRTPLFGVLQPVKLK